MKYFDTKFIGRRCLVHYIYERQSDQLEHSYFEKTAIKTSYSISRGVKGAGTTPTQIFTIIGFWLLGITNFFLGVCRAPTKGGS